MTSNHSALPWKARSGKDTNWWFVLEDKDGHEFGSGDGGLEECDAKLIVTAVNYHHRLREALRNLEHWTPYDTEGAEEARDLLAELDILENGL